MSKNKSNKELVIDIVCLVRAEETELLRISVQNQVDDVDSIEKEFLSSTHDMCNDIRNDIELDYDKYLDS